MFVEQSVYGKNGLCKSTAGETLGPKAQWVLLFGAKNLLCDQSLFEEIRQMYPKAYLMGCSTAGEIYGDGVADNVLTVTAVSFEQTPLQFASACIEEYDDCYAVAKALTQKLSAEGLRHVFVLSEGLRVNGSLLVAGLRENLPVGVTVTGGLSADGSNFQETYVIANGYAQKNTVVVVGFYGGHIRVGYGSQGGWDAFGIERTITRSSGNTLYEMDGKPVLDLYKEYLGDHSKNLPFSGLYFPLGIRSGDDRHKTVRTILGMNEEEKSLIFAGDMPEGYYAKLMKANSTNLIQGALGAARMSAETIEPGSGKLAILISCVGRKLVLKQMVDEEVEATREVLGPSSVYTGFYSYGEISHEQNSFCELHNQTMTITVLDEG